jgi:tetratricopeptide (TPR) repeat protein
MPIPRATKRLLLLTFLVSVTAILTATAVTRLMGRPIFAPEAWQALNNRDPVRAASLFNQALKEHPKDPMLHFGAASAAYAMGQPSDASSLIRTALELDPQFPEALALQGRLAYQRGDSDLAVRSMEHAVALRPSDTRMTELLDRWHREARVHDSYVEKPAEHFRILYEGGSDQNVGDHVARLLESEYVRMGRTFSTQPADPVTVILYTNREFHEITRSPAWAGGEYDGRIRVAAGGALSSVHELDRIVTHELVHAFVASTTTGRLPGWLNEGLASYLESGDTSWASDLLGRSTTTIPLEALGGAFLALDDQHAPIAYAESAIAAEILCAQLGANLSEFIQSVGRGGSVDQALLEYQVQPNAFHSEWNRRVGSR